MRTLATLLLPFRRYADFRGRSTRSELSGFYLVAILANLPFVMWQPGLDSVVARSLEFGQLAILICPLAALLVRRVHDVGFTGWWLGPMLLMAGKGLWETFERIRHPYWIAPDPPLPFMLAGLVYGLAMMVLLLWDGQEGANRFGPNPRFSPEPPVTSS